MADFLLRPDPRLARLARTLLDPPEGSNALEVLATVNDLLRAALPLFEVQVVAAARKEGRTWQEIADVVGMSRQNTYRKFTGLDGFGGRDDRRDER